jgi:hypothetical protein
MDPLTLPGVRNAPMPRIRIRRRPSRIISGVGSSVHMRPSVASRKIRVMRRPEEWPVQEALSWASNATTGATCRAENRSLSTAVVRSSFRTVSRDIWVVAMGATALTARTA